MVDKQSLHIQIRVLISGFPQTFVFWHLYSNNTYPQTSLHHLLQKASFSKKDSKFQTLVV